MKLRHKYNHGWWPGAGISTDLTDREQAEIDRALRRAAKAYRRAVKALERAQRVAASRPEPATLAAVDITRTEVLNRLDELRRIEALMQEAPGTSGAHHSGKGSVRIINKRRGVL